MRAVLSRFKSQKVRLHGPALKALQNRIYERDRGCCAICGCYVDPGEKFHHEPPKSQGGQDIEQNGIILCMTCHTERHGGKRSREIKDKCERILGWLYSEIAR